MAYKIDVSERFDTLEEAKAFVERYERAYCPLGYGTNIRIQEIPKTDTFEVLGYRYSSCD
jgi:predicted ATPase